jgi:L-ascorbate metabolism protein UlaG (beta-lactamase superfamily)
MKEEPMENRNRFLYNLIKLNLTMLLKQRKVIVPEPLEENSFNWLGHSTVSMNIRGVRIITDPVFENSFGFFRRKYILDSRNHMNTDIVLISHEHMDHYSLKSLKRFKGNPRIIVPPGYGTNLISTGFRNVTELKHDETYNQGPVTIRAIELAHDGRRYYKGILKPTNGYEITYGEGRIIVMGDTAYTDVLAGNECSIAFLPVGNYLPESLSYMHSSPDDAYRMFKGMNGGLFFPIHYQAFQFALDDDENTALKLLSLQSSDPRVLPGEIGRTYPLHRP